MSRAEDDLIEQQLAAAARAAGARAFDGIEVAAIRRALVEAARTLRILNPKSLTFAQRRSLAQAQAFIDTAQRIVDARDGGTVSSAAGNSAGGTRAG